MKIFLIIAAILLSTGCRQVVSSTSVLIEKNVHTTRGCTYYGFCLGCGWDVLKGEMNCSPSFRNCDGDQKIKANKYLVTNVYDDGSTYSYESLSDIVALSSCQ